MSAQLQLTDAELELIEANRVAEAARLEAEKAEEIRKAAEKKQRDAEREAANAARIAKEEAAEMVLIKALQEADTNGLLTFKMNPNTTTNTPEVTFMIGDREQTVEITEKIDSSSWRHRSTGVFQYTISGQFTEYKRRNYKNVKTLLARIAEFQEINACQRKAQEKKNSLVNNTRGLLAEKYPDATITWKEPCKWSDDASRYYTTYQVTTDKGVVVFTSSLKDDEIVLNQYSVKLSDEMRETVAAMILEG